MHFPDDQGARANVYEIQVLLSPYSTKMKHIVSKCVFSFGNTAHLFFLPKLQYSSTELLKLELCSEVSSLCSILEVYKYYPYSAFNCVKRFYQTLEDLFFTTEIFYK